jgi:hypothetical protein
LAIQLLFFVHKFINKRSSKAPYKYLIDNVFNFVCLVLTIMNSRLSKYFIDVCAKRLSKVDATKESNQHEIGTVKEQRLRYGTEQINFSGKLIYFSDSEEDIITTETPLTYYDTRLNQVNREPEFRIYYKDNPVIEAANPGDLLVMARTSETDLLLIIAPENSTSEKQLLWLFGLSGLSERFSITHYDDNDREIGFIGNFILEQIGVETEDLIDQNYLEILLRKYPDNFPSTKEFSKFARSTIKEIDPINRPDETIVLWMEREMVLFNTLEKYFVSERLGQGFGDDGKNVDEFISYSLSVQNRRKSRAGHSFENHLAQIFELNNIRYSKGAKTERNNKPDFLFPGISEYQNKEFSASLLTMLGVKTTAKDRWRQVLTEAARIDNKHLITLEPAISENQTTEMIENKLQLVIPSPIIETFSEIQKPQIIDLKGFIAEVRGKQNSI